MSFREQIGAAAKYGAFSDSFRTHGFRATSLLSEPVTLSPEELEVRVGRFAERNVEEEVLLLTEGQPAPRRFHGWSRTDLLKLRATLMLRQGAARRLSEATKNLALTRTYPHERQELADQGIYRNGTPGQQLSRSERTNLLDDIAKCIEDSLLETSTEESIEANDSVEPHQGSDGGEDFLIEHAYDLHSYPGTVKDKMQITRSVTVRALRDGLTEYRYTAESVSKGRGVPKLGLLAAPGAHFERLMTRSQAGIPGYQYQVVIPFNTPMMKSDPPRHFTWIITSRVNEKFFQQDGRRRVVGFRPSRELQTARVALQFASGTAPDVVAVVTNARPEDMDTYDPSGEVLKVVDGYVEKTWENPRIAHYCNLIWRR